MSGESTHIDHLIPEYFEQHFLFIMRIIAWSLSSGKGWLLSAENAPKINAIFIK